MKTTATGIANSDRLHDGREIRFDFLGPADRADLLSGFNNLSSRSRYLRFFSAMPSLPDFITDGLLKTDASNHIAIGARLLSPAGVVEPPVVGVARYYRTAGAPYVAEPAVAVVDDLHGLGLGKLLLRRLSRTARANGITHFRSHVLSENDRIRSLLRSAGAEVVEYGDSTMIYDVDIRRTAKPPRGVLARLLEAMLPSS